ncbi:hypothetical protein, partial [Streptomyces sp. NPDC060205]|uniref:hypothetical protein n=1 Tax=Streptomyces sp. NPDC060205 TaxID=3347072 RepID=UPI00364FAA60
PEQGRCPLLVRRPHAAVFSPRGLGTVRRVDRAGLPLCGCTRGGAPARAVSALDGTCCGRPSRRTRPTSAFPLGGSPAASAVGVGSRVTAAGEP